MFTVAGLSRKDGVLKLRFANDLVSRCKVLQRNGHQDIELVELPQAMSKDQAVAYLSTLDEFASTEAQAVFADYQGKSTPKTPQRKVAIAPKQEAEPEAAPQEEAPKAATKAPRKRPAKIADKEEDLA